MNPLRWPLYAQTLVGIAIGIAFGLGLGPEAAPLGLFAKGIVQILKGLATPLLFFAILEAILNAQFRGRGVTALLGVCAFNGLCAMTIAFVIANAFHTGRHLELASLSGRPTGTLARVDWAQGVSGFFPDSLVGPFVSNTVPAVILIAIVLGLAILSVERKDHALADTAGQIRRAIHFGFRVLVQAIEWVVRLVPLAVLGAVAKSVGEHGLGFFSGLAVYLVTCLSGMGLHVLLVYQGWVVASGRRLGTFWRTVREPVVYGFGVNSSLATLPVTLKALNRLGVSAASARLSACVGTNLNNDGILLYEVAAALFLAQAHGLDLSLAQQLSVAGIAIVATVGIPGIPEAGLISLSLVLTTVGLPVESLPVLVAVDWLLGRMRSVTNVLGDISVGIAIDRLTNRRESAPRAA